MKKYSILGLLMAASVLLSATGTAIAGCAEDIKAVEAERQNVNFRTGGQEDAYERMIANAKEALVQGKEKRCANFVKSARLKLN